MDDSSSTHSNTPERDSLLYFNGGAYRLLPLEFVRGGCFHLVKLGTREDYRGLFEHLILDLAMRERLRLQRYYWAAYFATWGGGDDVAWLVEQIFTGRLGLYEVVCAGPPRGEPKKPDEKKVRGLLSTAADNTPVVAPVKSALQAVTGVDLVTGEPVSRMTELAGMALGIVPGGKGIAKILSKGLGTLGKKIEKQMEKRGWNTTDIENTLESPHRTAVTKDIRFLPDGSRMADPATAYVRADGHYVVRNDVTKDIVQVSDRTNKDWKSPF